MNKQDFKGKQYGKRKGKNNESTGRIAALCICVNHQLIRIVLSSICTKIWISQVFRNLPIEFSFNEMV